MKAGEKVYFVLALHNHQPVGNLPHVFEENFNIAYEPFVEVLERFPNIKVGMHYTGSLLEWIEENGRILLTGCGPGGPGTGGDPGRGLL